MTTLPLDPLTVPVPELDAADAERLLADSWGIDGDLTPLHGERDLNFLVTDAARNRHVLKIHNPADAAGVIDFQTAAVRHIRQVAPALPVGDVVATRAGDSWALTRDAAGRDCFARVLTFLDGRHPDRDELSAADLFEWGGITARLERALRGFFHPAAGYPIAWDIARLPVVREWATVLEGEMRSAVLEVIDRHEQRIAPMLPVVRRQVVHNDLSRENVLVDDHNGITGITDFGDMTYTALVCDLAVTVADVLDGRTDSIGLAESRIAGYVSVTPLEPDEAGLLGDLVAGRCAAALAIQAWRQSVHPTAPAPSGGAWTLLQQLRAAGLDRVGARFATAALGSSQLSRRRSKRDLQAARSARLGPLSLSYDEPVHLVRGDGVDLYDADGRRYLDAYNNVPVLGHSHPAITAAVAAQLRLLNTNSRYLQEAPVELADRLVESMPDTGLDRVLFVNSGSEANDLAWRIACFSTGASGGIVTDFAYHGVTAATTALSPETWSAGHPPSNIRLVDPPGWPARTPSGDSVRTVQTAAADLAAAGDGVAAMFVDGVFTSDGILGPAADWTRDAAAAVRAAGGLYVADEVQAGHGRTGEHLWSFAAHGVDVDLVTLGKPMGNGYPVAAVIGRAAVVDPFIAATGYFSTFGGGTAACAAGLAVLQTLAAEDLIRNAREVGAHLLSGLAEVAAGQPRLARPRGWGLAIGVDVCTADGGDLDPAAAQAVVDRMRDQGVLIGTTGREEATLKIRPPLVFTAHHADRLVSELAVAVEEIAHRGRG